MHHRGGALGSAPVQGGWGARGAGVGGLTRGVAWRACAARRGPGGAGCGREGGREEERGRPPSLTGAGSARAGLGGCGSLSGRALPAGAEAI